MKQRNLWVLIALAALVLVMAAPALAGGWATITLDAWPQDVTAGRPVTISFVVRQHGRDDARINGLEANVHIRNRETGEQASFVATSQGEEGRYTAEVTFPKDGTWSWSIEAFTSNQPMPDLQVAAAAPVAAAPPKTSLPAYPLLAGGLGLALAAGIIVLIGGRRARWALALVVVGLVAGSVGLASAATKPEAAAPAVKTEQATAELGEKLFVAKGCIMCHSNNRIDRNLVEIQTDMGPALSNYTASAEYLRIWLKDPKAAKPQTQMPDLGLSQVEIDALIAFLSSNH